MAARTEEISRRSLLTGVATATAAAGITMATSRSAGADSGTVAEYLIGCGIADATGAVAGQGTMGYSDLEIVAEGLLMRTWVRAFIIVDRATGARIAFVTADIAAIFQSVHLEVMQRLAQRFGGLYTERNVNLNATHSHSSCGGTAREYAYSLAAYGFQQNSYEAEVSGIVAAIVAAHENLAPGTLLLGRGELHDASANRARVAFELNPPEDKAEFPDAIDPAVTVLKLRQGDKDVGAISWFATHGTSLTDRFRLIAGENKGYASYRWEHDERGVRHGNGESAFIAAFPQTNAGDMTPNINLTPWQPSGPTDDNFRNCALIGDRQYQAARAAFDRARPMRDAGVDAAVRYVDLGDTHIDGAYTPDGKPARTTPAMMGITLAANKSTDNYHRIIPVFHEGMTNPIVTALGGLHGPIMDWMRDAQAPKLILFPLGTMPPRPWMPNIMPIQIMRIGDLVLAAGPAEFTIVAGLRIRRVVARALGTAIENVLLQGYANGYCGYSVTPEEYVSQQYEGGHTIYGRWTLSAYMQEFDRLARALAARIDIGRGPAPLDWTSGPQPSLLPPVPADVPMAERGFGDVVTPPPSNATGGDIVAVEFVGAHPNNKFRSGGTYFEVQRETGGGWRTMYDDNDWCTRFLWSRPEGQPAASLIRIEWSVPESAERGRYRIIYGGDVKDDTGHTSAISGRSPTFDIR